MNRKYLNELLKSNRKNIDRKTAAKLFECYEYQISKYYLPVAYMKKRKQYYSLKKIIEYYGW